MKEFEARRLLMADPRMLDAELQQALDASASLRALRAELLGHDAKLHDALADVEVPAGLADRIVLRARYRTRARWGLGVAGALAAAAMAALVVSWPRGPRLEAEMIAHVDESHEELLDDRGVDPGVLQVSMRRFGMQARASGYRLRHLAHCVIAGREGRHFVIETPRGIVSFVLVPTRGDGITHPVRLVRGRSQGLFMPAGRATLGVVTQAAMDDRELERIAREVMAAT